MPAGLRRTSVVGIVLATMLLGMPGLPGIQLLPVASASVVADDADNQIVLARDGANLEVTVDGAVVLDSEFDGLSDIAIHGLGGNDTLTLDYGDGEVIPTGGIHFDGGFEDGAPGDGIVIEGAPLEHLVYDATGVEAGALRVSLDGGPLRSVEAVEIEPISIISAVGTLTVNVTDNLAHVVDIQDDVTTGPAPNLSEVTIDGGLETVQFTNPTTLLAVNTMGGGDTVTLNAMDAAWGADIEIDTGDDSDTMVVNATTAGTITEITTGVGSPDDILVGISDPADFATGVGDVSGILGELRLTDAMTGIAYLDNSSVGSPQTTAIQNRTAVVGTFASYGHAVVGLAPAFVWFDTTVDGGNGVSDLRIAHGTGNDSLIVDYTGPSGFGYEDPLPAGTLTGTGLFWDAGVTGTYAPTGEQNQLILQDRNETVDQLTYSATTVSSGQTLVTEAANPPSRVGFSDVGRVRDDMDVEDRTFNNLTAGHHKMVSGDEDSVASFLAQFNLDHNIVVSLSDYDFLIDPRVLIDAEPFGFAPWQWAAGFATVESLTINTSDDGDDDDKVEVLEHGIDDISVNTFAGRDNVVVFDMPATNTATADGGSPTSVPGDHIVFPDGATGPLAFPAGGATLPGGATVSYSGMENAILADTNEPNDSFLAGTFLGSAVSLVETDQTIHGPFDQDFFSLVALQSGALQVDLFHTYSDNRDLELALFDDDGDLIAAADTATDDESLVTSVVAGEAYVVRVRGSRLSGHTGSWNFNGYDLLVLNTPAVTAPDGVTMDPASDTGPLDGTTAEVSPEFLIAADLSAFTSLGIPDLGPTGPFTEPRLSIVGIGTGDTYDLTSTFEAAGTYRAITSPIELADDWYLARAYLRVGDGSTPIYLDDGPLSIPLLFQVRREVDLEVTKVALTADPVARGSGAGNLVYEVTVTNNDLDQDATGVAVTDALAPLPTGFTLDSAVASTGAYADPTWTVGSVAAGGSETLTLTLTVDGTAVTGTYDNTASVSAVNEYDTDLSNDSDSEETEVIAEVDLAVTKVLKVADPVIHGSGPGNLAYEVTVKNNSLINAATGVVLTDSLSPLPGGFTVDSAVASTGAYAHPVWTVGTVPAGGTATLTLTLTVDLAATAGTYANTMAVTAVSEVDTNATNDSATASVTVVAPPLHTVGLFDPATATWHLRNSTGAVTSFVFGVGSHTPFIGDWDCDGDETPGMLSDDGLVYLRNSNSAGPIDISYRAGNDGDIPLAGDFNGDGCHTVSLYRPSEGKFYVFNALGSGGAGIGAADISYLFGDLGDKPFVGDFDGDGIDTFGLHRETTGLMYVRNSHTTGIADFTIVYGNPDDRAVAGDFGTPDLLDTPAIFRPENATVYKRYSNTTGIADESFVFGGSTFLPVAGAFGLG